MSFQFVCTRSLLLLLLMTIHIATNCFAKTNIKKTVIENISDEKSFQKLLRAKENVFVLFVISAKHFPNEIETFRAAGNERNKFGIFILMDCESSTELKKICKKEVPQLKNYTIKLFQNGSFRKDYDRLFTLSGLLNFIDDPMGYVPWEDDKAGADVLHFNNYQDFLKYFPIDTRPLMVMFYVRGHTNSEQLRTPYFKAATELKTHGLVLVAVYMNKKGYEDLSIIFISRAVPFFIYFEYGQKHQMYEGEISKKGMIAFMKKQKSSLTKMKAKEPDWSGDAYTEVEHLTTEDFDAVLHNEKSLLVMFYAPWSSRSKRLKPKYEKAASIMRNRVIPGMLAAVDLTKETSIGQRYGVKDYPTLMYFVNGDFKYVVKLKEADKIIEFMLDPKEPQLSEKSWEKELKNDDKLEFETKFEILEKHLITEMLRDDDDKDFMSMFKHNFTKLIINQIYEGPDKSWEEDIGYEDFDIEFKKFSRKYILKEIPLLNLTYESTLPAPAEKSREVEEGNEDEINLKTEL